MWFIGGFPENKLFVDRLMLARLWMLVVPLTNFPLLFPSFLNRLLLSSLLPFVALSLGTRFCSSGASPEIRRSGHRVGVHDGWSMWPDCLHG